MKLASKLISLFPAVSDTSSAIHRCLLGRAERCLLGLARCISLLHSQLFQRGVRTLQKQQEASKSLKKQKETFLAGNHHWDRTRYAASPISQKSCFPCNLNAHGKGGCSLSSSLYGRRMIKNWFVFVHTHLPTQKKNNCALIKKSNGPIQNGHIAYSPPSNELYSHG